MTAKELQSKCRSIKNLTIEEVRDLLFEFSEDCSKMSLKEGVSIESKCFYDGEINAFHICLNLLKKVEGGIEE